jgi:hypothetical protein
LLPQPKNREQRQFFAVQEPQNRFNKRRWGMARMLVTGGCGFIGRHVAAELMCHDCAGPQSGG